VCGVERWYNVGRGVKSLSHIFGKLSLTPIFDTLIPFDAKIDANEKYHDEIR